MSHTSWLGGISMRYSQGKPYVKKCVYSSYFYKIDNDKKLCMYVYFYIFIYGLVEMENIEGITLIVNLDFLYVCGRGWWCRCEMDADMDFLDSSVGKEYVWNMGDLGLIPGLRRSPGEGKGYPLQYLENSVHGCSIYRPMDYAVHGVTKSQTRLSSFQLHFHFHEKKK